MERKVLGDTNSKLPQPASRLPTKRTGIPTPSKGILKPSLKRQLAFEASSVAASSVAAPPAKENVNFEAPPAKKVILLFPYTFVVTNEVIKIF